MSQPSVRTNFENSSTYTSDELLEYLMRELGVTNNNGSPIVGTKRWKQIQREKEAFFASHPSQRVAKSPSPSQMAVTAVTAPSTSLTAVPTVSTSPASSNPHTPSGTSSSISVVSQIPSVVEPVAEPVSVPVRGIAIGTRRRPIQMITLRGGGGKTLQAVPYSESSTRRLKCSSTRHKRISRQKARRITRKR
jgi:hypothetical protein